MSLHLQHAVLFWVALTLGAAALLRRHRRGYYTPRRRAVMTSARLATLLCLTLLAGGLTIERPSGRFNLVLLPDFSVSMGKYRSAVRDGLLEGIRTVARGKGTLRILSFAGEPLPPAGVPVTPRNSSRSDIELALRSALPYLPRGETNRVVLLSDGEENAGSALRAIPLLKEAGAQVLAFNLARVDGPDFALRRMTAPRRVFLGQPFEIRVEMEPGDTRQAELLLYRDGVRMETRTILFPDRRKQEAVFYRQAEKVGRSRYRVEVAGHEAEPYGRGVREAEVETAGDVSLAYLTEDAGASAWLTKEIKEAGVRIEVHSVEEALLAWESVSRADVILLDAVAAHVLGEDVVDRLERLVREQGKGLVVVGGRRGLGAGGYRDSRLETILPVTMGAPGRGREKEIALVLVMDTSQSMYFRGYGESQLHGNAPRKLDLAKQAVVDVIKALGPREQLGILDSADRLVWVKHLGPVEDKRILAEEVLGRRINSAGIYFYSSILEGYGELQRSEAPIRHMMVICDANDVDQYEVTGVGRSDDLISRMEKDGITLSVFSFGNPMDKDIAFLRRAASLGRGDFYLIANIAYLPRYFVSEYEQKKKSGEWFREEEFRPIFKETAGTLRSLSSLAYPPIAGISLVSLKEGATDVLSSSYGEPLLTTWRYGRGRVTVFAADSGDRWLGAWKGWPEARVFWTQVIWEAAGRREDKGGEVSVTADPLTSRLLFRIRGREGPPAEGSKLAAVLALPDGDRELPLERRAIERYRSLPALLPPGGYPFRVVDLAGEQRHDVAEGWVNVPAPAEVVPVVSGETLLGALVEGTGGSWVDSAEQTVRDLPPPARPPMALALWLALAAMLGLLAELLLRY